MSWLITPQLKVLNGVAQESILGIPFGGGYFAGYISHTADGNPTHALIVAPRATGATGGAYTLTTSLAWKTTTTTTANTNSAFDGAANTAAMVTAGIANHPAAQFCVNLNIGGYTDWYLPSRLEMDIAYYNLKPSTGANSTSFGTNAYAVPRRNSNYTSSAPGQTLIALFAASGQQAFEADGHWTSSENTSGSGWTSEFNNGANASFTKTGLTRVRAFRRITL
jgi:hypothetical protein